MSSYVAKPSDIERKWLVIDASGKTLGRLATEVAKLLRGKHKPTYTPFIDTGDYVIVVNASEMVLTGKKLDQKMYRHHSGYAGGLKEISYRNLMNNNPEKALGLLLRACFPRTLSVARCSRSSRSMQVLSTTIRHRSRKFTHLKVNREE